ncbi:MAG: SAM-dependent chlorinase/fluorinase [Solobacterium sp.]|nr:SAM-dependent chlorinase/fluorinase [Solobacterium sp.]
MKPIILLQSDFSLTWSAVATMKGVIKQVDPELEIHDLCHDIRSFDPWEASLSLAACEPYWPKGTIIVSVVDPGVGTKRRGCAALLKDGTIVITPDNGTLTHLKETPGIAEVREINTERYHHPGAGSGVFDGRDIFSYCAGLIASGKASFTQIGELYPVESVVECEEYHIHPEITDHSARGFIMTGLPHFGGIEINITNEQWKRTGFELGDQVKVLIGHARIPVFEQELPYVKSFGFVPKGKPLLYCGSSGFLSIDCNQDSFMNRYGIGTGKDWQIYLGEAANKKKK